MLFLSLSIREQRSFVRSVAWFLFCHCDRATVLCFALLCVGWPDIASYKHMKIYTNVCVRARFTIVTEMEKKLCWHNGNLLFMTRFSFSRCAIFFFSVTIVVGHIFILAVLLSPRQGQVFYEHLFTSGSSSLRLFFTAFIDQASCMDSNECYYLTASSWMKSHTMVHIEMSCKCFLGDFCLCCCYFTCFALFNEQFA